MGNNGSQTVCGFTVDSGCSIRATGMAQKEALREDCRSRRGEFSSNEDSLLILSRQLSTHLLLTHPPLLLLTPVLLGVFALTSIPFLTLLIRLGTIGYSRHPRENTWVFHIRPYAGWLICLVSLVWLWTWGVIRGVGRVAVAGVVGDWYFHRSAPRVRCQNFVELSIVGRKPVTHLL